MMMMHKARSECIDADLQSTSPIPMHAASGESEKGTKSVIMHAPPSRRPLVDERCYQEGKGPRPPPVEQWTSAESDILDAARVAK